jgi:hypothetical protein
MRLPLNVREVKARADFVALASRYTRLRRSGRQLVGLCPFHPERHPSFYVEPQRKIWKCFGCGAGGDLFTFLMAAEGCDFRRVLEIAAGASGTTDSKDQILAARRLRRESFAEIAARIVGSLPSPGFVPFCCSVPMEFRPYRGNRFGGVYRCGRCAAFLGPKELRAKLLVERGASCQWCCAAARPLQMHHVLKRGNQYDPASIVLLCSACHGSVPKVLAIYRLFERRSREWPERSEGHPLHSPEGPKPSAAEVATGPRVALLLESKS